MAYPVHMTTVRMVDPGHLAGIAEVARYFSVNKSTVSNWAARRDANGMPEPVTILDCGTIYDITELITWWTGWRPVKGSKVGSLPTEGVSSE